MVDAVIEALEVVALALLGVRVIRLRREVAQSMEAQKRISKFLYERTRKQISEHIVAPIHRR